MREKGRGLEGWGCMALWQALCSTPCLPQGLRECTLVEVASGHDMTVSDGSDRETAHPRSRQPKNPPASAVGSGQVGTQNTLTALRTADGSVVWTVSLPWAAPPPYSIGDTVYLNDHGDVRAFNAADGSLK